MKFVRWLGAFRRKSPDIEVSGLWDLRQTDVQVSAEPLVRGKSYLHHAKIGLSVAHPEATFVRGWLRDAFTVEKDGILVATRQRDNEFKNMDKFLKRLNKTRGRDTHAEATFNCPTYDAVVVKHDATEIGFARANRLAQSLKLPLRVL